MKVKLWDGENHGKLYFPYFFGKVLGSSFPTVVKASPNSKYPWSLNFLHEQIIFSLMIVTILLRPKNDQWAPKQEFLWSVMPGRSVSRFIIPSKSPNPWECVINTQTDLSNISGSRDSWFRAVIMIFHALALIYYHSLSVPGPVWPSRTVTGLPRRRILVITEIYILISQSEPPMACPLRIIYLQKNINSQNDRNRSYAMHHTHTYQGKQTVHQSEPCAWFTRPRRGHGEIRRFWQFWSSKLIVLGYQVKRKFGREITENDPRCL